MADTRGATTTPAVRWAIGLVEPLLPTATRQRNDDELRAATSANPAWAATFYAGVTSDLVLTLPNDDPWRHLNGRVVDTTVGTNPPTDTGATHQDQRPFGTWRDATDILDVVFNESDLSVDVAFAALIDPIHPAGAALIAAAGHGWETARTITQAIADSYGPVTLYNAGTDAIRWSLHRRRSYGISDDPWPIESVWSWAWRATQIAEGRPWPETEIEAALAVERIESAQVQPPDQS